MTMWGEELKLGSANVDEPVFYWRDAPSSFKEIRKYVMVGFSLAHFTDRLTGPWWVWRGMSTFSRLRGR